MTDPSTPGTPPADFADLPIQPTGSGVADLEIAYEQMRLADGDTTGIAASGSIDDIDAGPLPTGAQGDDPRVERRES